MVFLCYNTDLNIKLCSKDLSKFTTQQSLVRTSVDQKIKKINRRAQNYSEPHSAIAQ